MDGIKRVDLHIQRGEDFASKAISKTIDSVVFDLTGAMVYAQIRTEDNRSSDKIEDFTCLVDGAAVPNAAPTLNKITLHLTDVQTAALTDDGGYYDLLIVDAAGNDKYWIEGMVTIHGSVTVKP